jgi:ABC-2 type transport system ATP-binding protein
VPAETALFPSTSVRGNLRTFGRLQRIGGRELETRIEELLRRTGLQDRAGERLEHAAPGVRRIAAIATALVHLPRLLVIDEPATGLDDPARDRVIALIAGLHEEGLTVLAASSSPRDSVAIGDRIGFLVGGRVHVQGTARELVERGGSLGRVTLEARGDLAPLALELASLPAVSGTELGHGRIGVLTPDPGALLPLVTARAAALGWRVRAARAEEPDLAAAFRSLAGVSL